MKEQIQELTAIANKLHQMSRQGITNQRAIPALGAFGREAHALDLRIQEVVKTLTPPEPEPVPEPTPEPVPELKPEVAPEPEAAPEPKPAPKPKSKKGKKGKS